MMQTLPFYSMLWNDCLLSPLKKRKLRQPRMRIRQLPKDHRRQTPTLVASWDTSVLRLGQPMEAQGPLTHCQR